MNLTSTKNVDLPSFTGMTKNEAEEKAKELKLQLEYEEQYSTDVEEGRIISQDPNPETTKQVKQKSTVKIFISKGSQTVVVPKVAGMERGEAVKTLEELGLKVEVVEQTSKKVQEGIVIEQDVKVNEKINSGETVTITVSTGTGIVEVSVPSVTGKTEADAKTTLEGAKLKVSVNYEEDTSKQEGIVLKQDKTSGKKVEEGTTVTITVNKSESKSATVTVNIKSITGGYDTSDNDLENADKKVTVDIKVNGSSVFTQSNVDKNSTAISTSFSAKGNAQIVVNIKDGNGASYTRSKELNLGQSTSCTIE